MVRPEALEPNPYQPRDAIRNADVQTLADSLRQDGMLQPIVARRVGTGLEILAGERRWRAAQLAEMDLVPVLVRDATDAQMLEMALVENIHRSDLNAIEKAQAYRRLSDEFDLTPDEIGLRMGEDRTTVTNYLRLLELPREVKDMVANEQLTMGHARALAGVNNPSLQLNLGRAAVANRLSVRELEELVRQTKGEPAKTATTIAKKEKAAHVRDLEGRLQSSVGMKVTICPGRRKDRGKVIIEYNSLDDFDRLLAAFGVELE
jgi:ParB family chromosome partitioning protein